EGHRGLQRCGPFVLLRNSSGAPQDVVMSPCPVAATCNSPLWEAERVSQAQAITTFDDGADRGDEERAAGTAAGGSGGLKPRVSAATNRSRDAHLLHPWRARQ